MRHHWPTNWFLDAVVTAWIATGLSVLALIPVGAVLASGSVSDLLTTDDAWIGIAAAPWVGGFVLIGTAIGAWTGSAHLRWALGLLPLLGFSMLLILLDYTSDLGEGNQVVTAFGAGLMLAGTLAAPAVFVRRRRPRIMLSFLPLCVLGAAVAAFLNAGL